MMNGVGEAVALVTALSGLTWLAVEGAVPPDPNNVAAYVFGGGATVVLAGIVGEVARRLLNGSLIPRVIRDSEIEMGAAIVAAGQREDRVMTAVESLGEAAEALRLHNKQLASDLAEVTRRQSEHTDQTVAALARVIDDLRDEVRELRRGGQQ